MQFTKEDLKELAELAATILALKDTEEVKAIASASEVVLDDVVAKLKPRLEALNAFKTRLDIDAVHTMVSSGVSMDDAVALRIARISAGNTDIGKILPNTKIKKV